MKSCSHITFVNCIFDGNYASFDGGAIYSDSENTHVSIIASSMTRNVAGRDGGAYFAFSYQQDFQFIDRRTWNLSTSVESDHPINVNTGGRVVYAANVSISGATGYLVTFDLQTDFEEGLAIYDAEKVRDTPQFRLLASNILIFLCRILSSSTLLTQVIPESVCPHFMSSHLCYILRLSMQHTRLALPSQQDHFGA
jgi:predicted outer membrane repeat protein